MDNNMTAVVSLIMIGLGFVNGMVVCHLLDLCELSDLHKRLRVSESIRKSLQSTVNELEDDLQEEQSAKDELVKQMSNVLSKHSRIPPPEGPLTRSNAVSESSSDDETFPNPTSPNHCEDNKD